MAVQYNKDTGWGGFILDIYKAKKGIVDVSNEATKFFDKYKNNGKDLTQSINNVLKDKNGIDNFIKQSDLADKSLIEFLKDTKYKTKDLASYQQYLKDTGKSTTTFSSLTKKAGSVLKGFGAALGSMAVNWAIGEVIGLAITGIDYLINYEEKQAEAFENAKKNAKAAEEEIAELTKTQKEATSSISSISDEFAKLYQGVNQSTNENLTLTNEEYERFLELNNQIADSLEGSVLKWDENGNAILNFAGGVEQINNQIKDLLETQKLLNQQETNEKIESYIDGEDDSDGVTVALEGYKEELLLAQKKIDILKNFKSGKQVAEGSTSDSIYNDAIQDVEDDLELYSKYSDQLINEHNNSTIFTSITDEGINKLKDRFDKLEQMYTDEVSDTEKKIKSQNQRISSAMLQWAQGESEYQNAEEDKQTLMSKMIGQISWDEDGDFDSYTDEIKEQIFNKVDSAFENIEFRTQLQVLFDTDFSKLSAEDAIAKLREYVRNLIDTSDGEFTYERDPETGLSDYDRFMQAFGGGTDGIMATAKAKNQVLAYATGKTYSTKGSSDYASTPQNHKSFSEEDIRQIMDENGIDTQPEYEAFLKLLKNDKIVNIQELGEALQTLKISSEDDIEKFLNVLEQDNVNTIDDAVTESNVKEIGGHKNFKSAWKDLDSTDNDDLKELKDNLLDLAESGKLTAETFEKQEGASLFLDQVNMSAEEAAKKVNKLVENTKQLSSMRTGITAITSAYDEKKDSKYNTVSADTLNSMGDTLGVSEWDDKDLKVWENYKSVASDGTKSTKELKEAQDALATSFVNNGNYLANLTSKNKAYYKSLLEEMGVANADDIIKQQLIINEDKLTTQKINAKLATLNLASANDSEIASLSNELTNLYGTSEALGLYVLKKQLANANALDTSDSVGNLITLAKQCGYTGKAIQTLTAMQANLTQLENLDPDDQHSPDIAANIKSENIGLEEQLQKQISKKAKTSTAKTTGGNKTNGSSSSKDKNSSSNNKQEFDWIERRVTRLTAKISLLNAQKENLFTVKKKNANLDKQIANTTKLINTYSKAVTKYTKKANSVSLSASLKKQVQNGKITGSYKKLIKQYGEKTANKIQKYQDYYDKAKSAKQSKAEAKTSKRELQQEQYQNYVDLYDSRTSRAEAKEAIQTNYTDKNKSVETQIKNIRKSYEYQKEIAKLTGNKAELDRLEYELQKKVAELKLQEIQNIQDDYDKQIGLIDNNIQDIDNAMSLAEAKGKIVTASYYKDLNSQQTSKRANAVEERNTIQSQLAAAIKDGSIKVGSDEWYEVQSTLQELDNTINECDVSIAENNTAIRELHTAMLDAKAEAMNRANTEADFLANLLSRNELTDSDTGTMTNAGLGTLGTYGINLETAQSQLRELNKERAILEKMKKTGSLDFGDDGKHKYDSAEQLEEAYNDLIAKQQEWTQTEFDAEQKMIDLMKEYYQAQLDYMKEIIDAKKEALDYEKDLYDYQKNIAEKTKSIATLEKQAAALKGDTSEEGRARLAQIQLSLDEANQDLQDTEYERYISDQQDMLDNMYSEYEDLMQNLFKNTDKLLQDGINAINNNGTLIQSILNQTAVDYNYDYSDNFSNIVSAFGTSDTIVTGIKNSINGDESSISKKLDTINTTIETKYKDPSSGSGSSSSASNGGGDNTSGSSSGSTTQQTQTTNGQTTLTPDAMDKIEGTSGELRKLKDALNAIKGAGFEKYWTKKNGTPKSYINKRIAAEPNYDKTFNGKHLYSQILTEAGLKHVAKKLGLKHSSGSEAAKELSAYAKKAGFQTGGIIRANGVPLKGDNVPIRVNPNETVLTQEFTDMLPTAVDMMDKFVNISLPNYSALTNANLGSQTIGDIVIQAELPNVTNAQDFVSALQNDTRVQKALTIATKDLMNKGRITNNIQSIM